MVLWYNVTQREEKLQPVLSELLTFSELNEYESCKPTIMPSAHIPTYQQISLLNVIVT